MKPDSVLQQALNTLGFGDKQAKKLLPQLKSIHNIGDRPKVRFYEGIDGLKQVYEDTLTSKEEIRAFATVDDMHRTLPDYFPKIAIFDFFDKYRL